MVYPDEALSLWYSDSDPKFMRVLEEKKKMNLLTRFDCSYGQWETGNINAHKYY